MRAASPFTCRAATAATTCGRRGSSAATEAAAWSARQAGFDFPGTDPTITFRQTEGTVEGAERLAQGGWQHTPTGVYVYGPVPGRVRTVELDGPPADRDAPVTAAEMEASLRRVSGVDVRVTEVTRGTRFTDNARQATTYRRGRVLLCGDAAHVHSPFSGQGLNLGIGDAVNLGWKLAATVQGWAPEGLLDTYTSERHPIGAWVLDWTRAQVAVMRGDAYSSALRGVVTDFLGTTRRGDLLRQADLRPVAALRPRGRPPAGRRDRARPAARRRHPALRPRPPGPGPARRSGRRRPAGRPGQALRRAAGAGPGPLRRRRRHPRCRWRRGERPAGAPRRLRGVGVGRRRAS